MKSKVKVLFFYIICILLINDNTVYANYLDKKEVLIIHSYHTGFEWSENIESGILSVLEKDKTNVQIEYMDAKWRHTENYYDILTSLYRNKYENREIDVIICSDNEAFEFIIRYKDEIFPNTPVVFCGVNNYESYNLDEVKSIVGVQEEVDIKSNIELILKVHPDTKNIITLIDDTLIGKKINQNLLEVIKENDFGIPIHIIKGKTLEKTINQVNTLSQNSVILFMSTVFKEDNEEKIYSMDAVPILVQKTEIPIYGCWDTLLGRGIIGGKITSGFEQGVNAGKIAKRILQGESINDIPYVAKEDRKFSFDYEQMKRFNIKSFELPEDNIIINSPQSVYSISKELVTEIAFVIIIIFAGIIILLIINNLIRRKIQRELKESKVKLQKNLKLKEAMIEVNQSIIGIDNISELFDLILEKAIEAIEKAEFGSILTLNDDNMLKMVAFKGYDSQEAKKFYIPLQKSLQWVKTNGNIDKVIVINDIDEIDEEKRSDFLDTIEKKRVKSYISAPIMIEDKLYGIINIDSVEKKAFSEEDLEIMEYLKRNIEIAISKHILYKKIIYLSRYDKLTNVYNRRYFEERFYRSFENSILNKEKFFLVVFDLNDLKVINDTYGHLVGDEYIKTFARTLNKNIKLNDIFARYGGDEFVAVFFDIEEGNLISKLEKLAQKFRKDPIDAEGNNIVCSFSYGIANFPNDAISYDKLVKTADGRMYEYKQKVKIKNKGLMEVEKL